MTPGGNLHPGSRSPPGSARAPSPSPRCRCSSRCSQRLDVVVAAQREEVVLLVVIDRRPSLVASTEGRVRVGVDVDVIRVVVRRPKPVEQSRSSSIAISSQWVIVPASVLEVVDGDRGIFEESGSRTGPVGELEQRAGVDSRICWPVMYRDSGRWRPGTAPGWRMSSGLHVGDRHGLEHVESRLGVLAGRALEIGTEDLVKPLVVEQMGVAVGGVDRVHADEAGGQVPGHLLGCTPTSVRLDHPYPSAARARSNSGCRWLPGIRPAVEPVMMTEAPSARCGRATATAFITPSRSTSVASTKSDGVGVAQRHWQ